MECNLNKKKLLVGGLAAGVWVNLVDVLVHGKFLHPRYEELTKMGFYHAEPKLCFLPIYVPILFVVGLGLAFLYAAARDTLKPGPCAAVKIGIVTALIAALPAQYAAASWSITGKYIPFVTTIAIFIECIGGALIAGAIYKPKA